ncbi:hypothetical protein RIR_jg31898.t1 [Rhizophagus irregularis DAOM 181602=DAOM 197198]|nr:hypothetical protein RIR_jg31898.t1 [Rhizophagus irregularis DAOM 181602=DAOM 197198]
MSSIVVLLPEELSTRYNGCPLKMIGHRPEISLIRGNGWSGRKHLQRKRIKLKRIKLTLSCCLHDNIATKNKKDFFEVFLLFTSRYY